MAKKGTIQGLFDFKDFGKRVLENGKETAVGAAGAILDDQFVNFQDLFGENLEPDNPILEYESIIKMLLYSGLGAAPKGAPMAKTALNGAAIANAWKAYDKFIAPRINGTTSGKGGVEQLSRQSVAGLLREYSKQTVSKQGRETHHRGRKSRGYGGRNGRMAKSYKK